MEKKKVLFYTFTPRAFRSVLIGHLYAICQKWPTVLISEKMDAKTESILNEKSFFPYLENIMPISQFTGEIKKNLFSQNKYLYSLARKAVEQEKPHVVISASDMHSIFEMYLMRFAKKSGAMVVCFQTGAAADSRLTAKWVERINAEESFSRFLPLFLRIFLARCRKWIGHILYHWILPLSVGQKPLTGKSSYILWKGIEGMRQADYQVVFSKRDFETYLASGVSKEKLRILPHPLAVKGTRSFLEQVFFEKSDSNGKKNILLLVPIAQGFKRSDWSPILYEDRLKSWLEIISLVKNTLPGWEITVSPHPSVKDAQAIQKKIKDISPSIVFNLQDPVEKCLSIADAVVGLPRSASTVLFIASLQDRQRPIATLDFDDEIIGDFYKNFEGIDYISNQNQFVSFLKKIGNMDFRTGQKSDGLNDYGTLDLLKDLINEHDKETGS